MTDKYNCLSCSRPANSEGWCTCGRYTARADYRNAGLPEALVEVKQRLADDEARRRTEKR